MNVRSLVTIFLLFILNHAQASVDTAGDNCEIMSLVEEPENEGCQKDNWSCGPCSASAWLRLCFFCHDIDVELPSYQQMQNDCPRFYIKDLQKELLDEKSSSFESYEDESECGQLGPSMLMLQEFLTQWTTISYPQLSLTFTVETDRSETMLRLKEKLFHNQSVLLLIQIGLRQHSVLSIGSFPMLHFILVLAYDASQRLFWLRDSDGTIESIFEDDLKQKWYWTFKGDHQVVDFLRKHNIVGGQFLALTHDKN